MANVASAELLVDGTEGRFRFLGRGVYSIAEASRYAGVSAATARSWFKGRSDRRGRGPLLSSDYEAVEGDFALSFLDLIDLYVAGQFRVHGAPMHEVRAAHGVLQDDLKTGHPFAHSELFLHGKTVIRQAAGALDKKVFCAVTNGQLFFDALEAGLQRIDYARITQLAARWRIAEGVLIDPTISFGKPTVSSRGTTTAVLARQYNANGRDATLVADIYDITEQDVLAAVDFENAVGRAA